MSRPPANALLFAPVRMFPKSNIPGIFPLQTNKFVDESRGMSVVSGVCDESSDRGMGLFTLAVGGGMGWGYPRPYQGDLPLVGSESRRLTPIRGAWKLNRPIRHRRQVDNGSADKYGQRREKIFRVGACPIKV